MKLRSRKLLRSVYRRFIIIECFDIGVKTFYFVIFCFIFSIIMNFTVCRLFWF